MEFYYLVQETTENAADGTPCPGPTKILGTMLDLPKEGEKLVYIDENGFTIETGGTVKEVCSEDGISHMLFTTIGNFELIWQAPKET